MLGSPLSNVRSGLRKGIIIALAFLGAGFALGLLRVYADSFNGTGFNPTTVLIYTAIVAPLFAVVLGYQAYSFNPRLVKFIEGLGGRIREADYVPWGTKKRGLMIAFDSGLLFTVSRNFLAFRIVTDSSGNVLPLSLDQWAAVLRGYRGATRTLSATTRKGDVRTKAELQQIAQRLGGRAGMVSVFQKSATNVSLAPASEWNAVALFSIPRWLKHADGIGGSLDEIQRLLQGMVTSPAA